MNRILAVVAPTEADAALLKEAGTVAAGTGVEVVVLALDVEGSENASVDAMRQWEGFDDVGNDESVDTAHRFADHFGDEILGPMGVSHLAIGDRVENTRPSAKVIDVAENHACDHVFITNRRRSPAGKALFGNTPQSIILSFDGFVTVRTA